MNKRTRTEIIASRISSISIPVALAISISLLLIGQDIERALADTSIVIITPTGGGITSSFDCTDISASNSIVWQTCPTPSPRLFAISATTDAVIANITIGSGAFRSLPCNGTDVNCVLIADTVTNTISKYSLSGGVITLTGSVNPCDLSTAMKYDSAGYIFVTCSATDEIARINPAIMLRTSISGDLTDGSGIECDNPFDVAFDPTVTEQGQIDIGVIRCSGVTNNIVTFTIDTSTSYLLLDEIAGGIGTVAVNIDTNNNRILAVNSTSFDTFSYSLVDGTITFVSSISGNTFDDCEHEPKTTNGIASFATFSLCQDSNNPVTKITAFMSNTTGVFQVLNSEIAFTDSFGIGMNLVTTDNGTTWYINSILNNEKYIKLTGMTVVDLNPEPPASPPITSGGEIVGGVNCSLPENAQKLLCRIGGDGSIGSAGAFVVGDGSDGTGVSGIACSLGFVDCTVNEDVKTNGIGYLMFIAGVAIMIGLFFIVSRGNLLAIPTFIWIIGILSLAGAMALFNIIDPVIFIITIVAVIALAVPKILSTIRGDQTLGAGNTA